MQGYFPGIFFLIKNNIFLFYFRILEVIFNSIHSSITSKNINKNEESSSSTFDSEMTSLSEMNGFDLDEEAELVGIPRACENTIVQVDNHYRLFFIKKII